MKKSIIIFFILVLILIGFIWGSFLLIRKKENNFELVVKKPTSLCYLYSKKAERGFYDKAYLRLNILNEKVTGEFNSYLAEKDSKVGDFEGTVGSLDQKTMGRIADLWWNSFGEGMRTKEELVVLFGDGSASALGGEMIDRGDGVYVYKDKTKLSPGLSFGQISCEDLDEINIVEKYVKDNIKTIAINKPVLGGSWNVMSVFVNYALNEGTLIYEDGHIQSSAKFSYNFDSNTKDTTITKFEVQK